MPRSSRYEYDNDRDEDRYYGSNRGSYGGRSRSRYEEDEYSPRYSRGYEQDEEYGSSRHGRTRHEPVEVERENRRRGALRGWGEDPDEVLGSRREESRYSSRSGRRSGGYEEEAYYPQRRRASSY